jgi:DNA polymerase
MAVASEFSDIRQLYKLWTSTEFREQYPVFDVYNTGGIAQPGPDFVEFASKLVPSSFDNAKSKTEKLERKQELQRWVNCLYWQAMYYPNFRLPVKVKGAVVQAQFVGGHLWNYDVEGPKRSESGKQIMIIGKNPQRADEQQGRNFVDSQGDLLQRVLVQAGFSDSQLDEAYVTNVVKHGKLDPSSKNLAASWVRNCLPILQQEIAIVRPDFVLLLGSEPLKLLIHKSHNVSDMVGRVLSLDYRDVAGECRAAKVISAVHPSSIAHEPNRREQLEASCRDFCHLVNGTLSDRTETDIDHRVIDTSEELEAAVSEILAEPGDLILAVDCEWNGEAPYEANAYLRTIQISHKAKSAICVVLHRQHGVPAFDPKLKSGRKVGRNDAGFKRAIAILKKLFFVTDRRVRVGGHFFRADLPWLMDAGLDLRELYAPPRVDAAGRRQAAERIKYEGGFDTGLMFFAISETSELKLETLAMKYTSAPRYDTVKDAELTKYCKENKVSKKGIEGYGFLTDDTLHSYALYDADVTRRLYDVAAGTADSPGLLSGDENGLDCWNAYFMSHRASLAFLEMEQTGIRIDRHRAMELINKFNDAYVEQLDRFRKKIKWPGFNPKSVDQVREFLFGEDLGRLCNKTGRSVRLRPKHAVCKFAEPIKTSGKPSKDWGRVVDEDETHIYRPSTDKETLGILGRVDPDIWALRQIRFTGQVLQTVLRLPDSKDSLADYLDPDDEIDDDLVFDGGILSHVRSDGRVHTRLSQTKETGRAGSSNPNMQNLCVDDQTEFLTSRGWVRGAELRESDIVGAFSVDNDEQFRIELVAPEMVHSYDYSGDMIGFNLPGTIDFLVTPNHRMVAWNTQYKKLHVSEAAEASLHKPLNVIGGGFLQPDPDCRNFYQAVIGEFILSEMAAAGNLGHVGTAEKFLLQQAAFYPGQLADMHELYAHSWMRLFKKMNVESRLRVTEFVRLLFSYRRKQNKLTGKLADLVQACFSLSSRAMPAEFQGDVLKFHLKRRSGGKHAFAYRMDRATKTTQSYTGKVYCVTVPSSFIVVRRNGCIGVTGNSKRREKDYKDILGKERYAPVRSMIIPDDDCVLVEADYKSAELAMIGWAAQCPQMIEDVRCNNLPEDDPRHADIHTRTAVTAFNLDLAGHRPTKHWIEDVLKRGDLRIGAKTVNFGIPYGRGDEATARTCREEGVAITLEQAAALRQGYFSRYPEIEAFLLLVAERATTVGWISGWARRYRRFAPTSDEKLQKAQGREACNFPIQNGVAEAMNIALDNLYRYREQRSVRYRIALQVHDAVLLEVPKIYVAEVVHEVLPRCMDEWVHIWPKYLNGEVIPVDEPYHFGIDTEIFYRWGVKLTKEEKLELGV